MKTLVQRLYASPNYIRALEWGRLITITGSAQVAVQAIGFCSGILVIRLLPIEEYALYTLANTMLGTMTLLADGGISTGVMAQGGKVWQDRGKLGAVLATGLDLRRKFAIASLLIATPALFYLLRHHEVSWVMSLLIILSLIPAFFMALSGTLLQIVPQLHQNIPALQKNQVSVNIGRLAMLSLTLFAFPWAFVAVLAGGLPQIWANMRLRQISSEYADWNQPPDAAVRKSILGTVKRILPGAVYHCVSGQITIWLITFFGSTVALAQVGALGRFTMVLNLFNVLFSTLVVPRFARLSTSSNMLLKRFLFNQAGLLLLSLMIVFVVSLFSKQILWILGDDFKGLTDELILIVVGGCVALLNACTHKLLLVRGIIVPPVVFISSAIAVQVGIAFTVELDKVIGVLLYGIYTTAVIYAIQLIYLCFVINKKKAFQNA